MKKKKKPFNSKSKDISVKSHKPNWSNTLGDIYDLKKMCREKGYKLLGNK